VDLGIQTFARAACLQQADQSNYRNHCLFIPAYDRFERDAI